jgi:hypothetical protein
MSKKQQFPLEHSSRMSAVDAAIGVFNVRGKDFEPDEVLRLAAKVERFYQTGAVADDAKGLKVVG